MVHRDSVLLNQTRGLIPSGIDADLFARNAQVPGHEVGVILTDREKAVDVLHLAANQIERLFAIRIRETVEKQVLALQRASDRNVQRFLQWFSETD